MLHRMFIIVLFWKMVTKIGDDYHSISNNSERYFKYEDSIWTSYYYNATDNKWVQDDGYKASTYNQLERLLSDGLYYGAFTRLDYTYEYGEKTGEQEEILGQLCDIYVESINIYSSVDEYLIYHVDTETGLIFKVTYEREYITGGETYFHTFQIVHEITHWQTEDVTMPDNIPL